MNTPQNAITAQQILKDPLLRMHYMDNLSRRDLFTFASHVLGYTNAEHHREWYGILENKYTMAPGADWDDPLILNTTGVVNDRIALFAPRNHSKSTCFTVNYTLQTIGNNPNVRILIVSGTGGQSGSFLREVKGHMVRNENYRRVYGNLFPKDVIDADKWTGDEIIVRRSNTKMKDPTVGVTSALGTVLSRRADIIICDDILNEKNTRTADQRAKTKEWFNEVLMPVLEPDGILIWVATAWNLEDLSHELMKKATYKVRKRYKAIIDDKTQEVLWPERWPYTKLMDLKEELGTMSFNKSYQNEAVSDEYRPFKEAWLQSAIERGKNRTLIYQYDPAQSDLGRIKIVLGVDLAISQKEDSDMSAFAVLAELENGDTIPLHLSEDKLTFKGVQDRIKDLNKRFRPSLVIVENNGYQEALRRDMADTTSIPIRGYTTGGEKFDPDIGLNSLAVEFENGKWILPYDSRSPATIKIVDSLLEGMRQFPSGHTADILMATWLAKGGMRQLSYAKGQGTVRGGSFDIYNNR